MRPNQRVTEKTFVYLRSRFLFYWTKISEPSRDTFFMFVSTLLNYLLNAVLFAIPVSIFFHQNFWLCMLAFWALLPLFEHYYVWVCAGWNDPRDP